MDYSHCPISGIKQCQGCGWRTSLSAIISHEDFEPDCSIVKKQKNAVPSHFCPSCEWSPNYPISHTEWSNSVQKCVTNTK